MVTRRDRLISVLTTSAAAPTSTTVARMKVISTIADWRTDMREFGLRLYAVYLAHPQAAVLAASRVGGRPNEIRVIETNLGLLRSAGFPDAEAVQVYHVFIDQMLGLAALDAAFEAMSPEIQRSDDRTWQEIYARLPAETHPNIAATCGLLEQSMRHSICPAALDLLLDGIAARLAQTVNSRAR